MSGIIGIYYLDGRPVDSADLGRMVDILAHRGPDGADIWVDGSVGFGHRMLWTTPESLIEELPLLSQTGDFVITSDARIDNRDELIRALHFDNCPPEKITDSQLVLAGYEKWGEQCPEHLIGDFAFVIWDKRKQKLFCARDPMGVKPLYYYYSGKVFAFASELKALLCLPEVPRQINEMMVAYYLVGFFDDKASTFYKDILSLPGAHSLTVDCGGIKFRSYWSVDLSSYLRFSSRQEYAEAFRDIFTQAVRCRMRSAFPLGSMLSGGLDSSSIACVARNLQKEVGNKPVHTFSYIFPTVAEIDPKIDERCYMDAVVETGGFKPYYVHADKLSPLVDLNQVFWHLDGAFPAPNLYMDWALFKAGQQQGVRVLLTGHDGDTTVSYGYESLTQLARTGKWIKLIQEATELSKRFYNSAVSPKKLIWTYALTPLLPEPALNFWRTLRKSPPQSSWAVQGLIDPNFAQRLGLVEHIQSLDLPAAKTLKEEHWQGVTNGLLQYALQSLEQLATAFHLELRHPFCDRRLIEFCLAVPPEHRLHQGWTRAVMRDAMTDILPPAVQWRVGKANLSTNFSLRLLEHEKATLEEVLVHKPQMISPYVDVAAVTAAHNRYVSQPLQHKQDAFVVFLAANLGLWLKESSLTT